jgi:hypothetical protein
MIYFRKIETFFFWKILCHQLIRNNEIETDGWKDHSFPVWSIGLKFSNKSGFFYYYMRRELKGINCLNQIKTDWLQIKIMLKTIIFRYLWFSLWQALLPNKCCFFSKRLRSWKHMSQLSKTVRKFYKYNEIFTIE